MPFSIRIRLLAFLGLLAGGAGTCAGAAVTLVEQGKPRAAIVLDAERPTRAAQFAAFELQHVIRLITDAELPIVRGPDGVAGAAILVGDSQAARAGPSGPAVPRRGIPRGR